MSSHNPSRRILHVDMDAFYASVEQRDRPEYAGKPVIVGGLGNRGVVSAASYQARAYGVRSAMPIAEARRRCPQGIYLKPDISKYRRDSATVFGILAEYSPLIEPLSLDEAFVDVTGSIRLKGDALDMAHAIRRKILATTGLVASVGLSVNKFLAKLASDFDKPDGLFVVLEDDVQAFLDPMPVARLWGVGKRLARVFSQYNIRTVAELRQLPVSSLTRILGKQASHFHRLCRGIDDRPVIVGHADKSISHETTFDEDQTDDALCQRVIMDLAHSVAARLRNKKLVARTIRIKVRDHTFRTWSRSRSMASGIDDNSTIYACALELFRQWRTDHAGVPIRLLGVGSGNLLQDDVQMFSSGSRTLSGVSDSIHSRFGKDALKPARLIRPETKEEDDSDSD